MCYNHFFIYADPTRNQQVFHLEYVYTLEQVEHFETVTIVKKFNHRWREFSAA